MKMLFQTVFLVFLTLIIQMGYAAREDNTAEFVSMSDIHFNPYESCSNTIPCPLVEELRQAEVKKWEQILLKYQKKPVSYGSDSNYPLLRQLLQQLKMTPVSQARFVVVLGDLLSHDFANKYFQYANDKSIEGLHAFVRKTLQFVASEMHQSMPDQDFYIAVGNNDSYDEDYEYDSTGQFYRDTAITWGQLISDANTREAMQQTFKSAGYYAVNVPSQPNLRLIVLNTVLFSMNAKGEGVDVAAKNELDWFQQEMNSLHEQKALIIMHIPVGVDVYGTVKSAPANVVELWKPEYTARFLSLLKQHASHISGLLAGHFHMDFSQIVVGGDNPVLMSGMPGVSPLFGNNPGFKLFQYSETSLNLQDYTTYYDSLSDNTGWRKEYDFNESYQPGCSDCRIVEGVSRIEKTGDSARNYQKYFSAGTESQPITKYQKWLPYYWCEIQAVTASDYQNCIEK